MACVANVSVRVRRERWDESRKKRNDGDWYLVHQNLSANRFGTMFDVDDLFQFCAVAVHNVQDSLSCLYGKL